MTFTGRATRPKAVHRAKPQARGARRRKNPMELTILNPLPRKLQAFAAKLSPAERKQFLKAVVKYREFHGVYPTKVDQIGSVEGKGRKFLVGIGATEDVSYSTNLKGEYRGSNKQGTPFRHEFSKSKPHMATDASGKMIVILNRSKGRKFKVADWIRG